MTPEKAQEINSSGLWEEICRELDLWIASELNKLKTCSAGDLGGIQQTVRNFEQVKRLPQIVIDRD